MCWHCGMQSRGTPARRLLLGPQGSPYPSQSHSLCTIARWMAHTTLSSLIVPDVQQALTNNYTLLLVSKAQRWVYTYTLPKHRWQSLGRQREDGNGFRVQFRHATNTHTHTQTLSTILSLSVDSTKSVFQLISPHWSWITAMFWQCVCVVLENFWQGLKELFSFS